MEELQSPTNGTSTTPTSLLTRLTNVFTSPSELYEEVAVTPVQKSSWVVPWILALLMGVIIVVTLYSDVTLREQMLEIQSRGMQKAVEEGKMSQEQFEQIREQMSEAGAGVFIGIGAVSSAVIISLMLFGATFALWLVAKFGFKAVLDYSKMLEVYGLATIVGVLGSIVSLLLMLAFHSMYASSGLGIAVIDSFDPENQMHQILAAINLFSIWQTAVVGIGLAKTGGKPLGTGLTVAFGLWIIWVLAAVTLGLGLR